MGVGALTASAIRGVLHRWPDAEIFLLDYCRSPQRVTAHVENREHTIQEIGLRFSWRLWLQTNVVRLLAVALGLRLLPWKRARGAIVQRHSCLRMLSSMDLFASVAGGDSFSDLYGVRRVFYIALPQFLVLAMNKLLLQLPQTYGPFNSPVSRMLARRILRNSDVIFSRDLEGVAFVRSLLGDQSDRSRFCYDLAFALEPIVPSGPVVQWIQTLKQQAFLVGVNVSGLLYVGGYSQNNMFRLKDDYQKLLDAIIQNLITGHNAQVLLLPHVLGAADHLESDQVACRKVYEKLASGSQGRLHLLEGQYDQHELKYLIGQCDLFIGSRMHACIAALSQAVPAVSLAYSAKFIGVMKPIGAQDLVADLRALDAQEVLAIVSSAIEQRSQHRARLRIKLEEVIPSVLNLFSEIGGDSGLAVRPPVKERLVS